MHSGAKEDTKASQDYLGQNILRVYTLGPWNLPIILNSNLDRYKKVCKVILPRTQVEVVLPKIIVFYKTLSMYNWEHRLVSLAKVAIYYIAIDELSGKRLTL